MTFRSHPLKCSPLLLENIICSVKQYVPKLKQYDSPQSLNSGPSGALQVCIIFERYFEVLLLLQCDVEAEDSKLSFIHVVSFIGFLKHVRRRSLAKETTAHQLLNRVIKSTGKDMHYCHRNLQISHGL